MALIGNLRNFLSSMQAISILGLYEGVVKYIAEFKSNTKELSKVLSTSFYLGFIATVLVSFTCFFQADVINDYLFSLNYDYAFAIKILALALPLFSLNMFSFSILNGFSKFRIIIVINIIGQILGLAITLFLIWQSRIDGALISVAISESLIFLITLVGIVNQRSLMPLIKASVGMVSIFLWPHSGQVNCDCKITLEVMAFLFPHGLMDNRHWWLRQ